MDCKFIIICNIHGEFKQIANNHLLGRGCPKCGIDSASRQKILTTSEYIMKAKSKHGDMYDYSKVNYKNSGTKVIIICTPNVQKQIYNSNMI